ncbi:uncharacterized protein LOC108040902 [Drosophila rhopaloa]|uniref:Mitochondrial splicing suppressor 51-like C-terminal domain-containing protein n=1 Tax=Drosophila rhopaloa TaxID=1041015 RepID=A0ABM5H3U9_DRORH|nr:uncharacterized protein LOC108040902 [Drosophila rhopaloa]XP_044315261.1 uncharacterized protein LOC108040902 [Drosophila rhopaloa]
MTTSNPPFPLRCYVCVNNVGQIWNKVKLTTEPKKMTKNLLKLPKLLEKAHVKAKVICRGCKMQQYCSVPHLIADRPGHQPLCQVLRDLQKFMNIEHPLLLHGRISDRSKLQFVISQLKLILWIKLGRPLAPRENQLIGNPVICDVCFSTDALQACEGCAGVAYCSGHLHLVKDIHSPKECRTLALIATPLRQLDCLQNITKFYEGSSLTETHLIDAFFKATSLNISEKPIIDLEEYQLLATCSSFSGIASLCLALTHIFWVSSPDKAFIVYVVGATEEHLRYFQIMHLQFLFLHYPNIRHLELMFIGKSLEKMEAIKGVLSVNNLKRTVIKRFYPLTFSQFSSIYNVDPTLIFMLQPDFIGTGNITQDLVKALQVQTEETEFFSWIDCLSSIVQLFGIPICYTSISKVQAKSDFTAINMVAKKKKIAVKRVYNLTDNPFREIIPFHNPSPENNERIVYENNYLEVVFTKNK